MNTPRPDPAASVPCSSCGRLNRVRLNRAADSPKCGHCGTPIRMDRPIRVMDAHFEKIIADAQVPVLVDFYADWCGPCKMMAPLLDDLARNRMGKAVVLKLNTDESPAASQKFQIRGIPTLIVFENGRERDRQVGAVGREALEQLI